LPRSRLLVAVTLLAAALFMLDKSTFTTSAALPAHAPLPHVGQVDRIDAHAGAIADYADETGGVVG